MNCVLPATLIGTLPTPITLPPVLFSPPNANLFLSYHPLLQQVASAPESISALTICLPISISWYMRVDDLGELGVTYVFHGDPLSSLNEKWGFSQIPVWPLFVPLLRRSSYS